MHWIDWLIVALTMALVAAIGVYTQRFVRGVADFLTAGRVAGRYVVSVSSAEASMGLVSMVAIWEMYYKVGFAVSFWEGIATPIYVALTLTGYCIYRYRETRAMTMGQLLEIRYSRSFRIYAGVLASISGIVNYGLFPAVGARFIVYFCGFPAQLHFLGMEWPTFAVVMALFLTIGALLAILGGQLTVMTTDCMMGMLSYPIYLAVVVALLSQFSWWNEMAPTLMARPPGQSMLNPFDVGELRDFNIFFIFVGIFAGVYGGAGLVWQGAQGYNAAAINAHEQKMSRILGNWRGGFSMMMIIFTAAAAYTYFNHANFAERAAVTEHSLQQSTLSDIAPSYMPDGTDGIITPAEMSESLDELKAAEPERFQTYETIRKQMQVPMAMRDILPIGILGAFLALMIFLMVSTDSTYLHSWGTILVQDIVLPLRKKPFTLKQQLFWLRVAIALVALYGFLFSFFFGQVTYILMFFALTGAIWAGAGAVIVLGLYWPRGTAAGAWVALTAGAGIAIGGLVLTNAWVGTIYPFIAQSPAFLGSLTSLVETISGPMEPIILWRLTPERFFINGQELNFLAMIVAIFSYVGVSLLTCREKFNMDRMLHRGEFARKDDLLAPQPMVAARKRGIVAILKALTGIDANFTRGDKILSWSVIVYTIGYGFGSFLLIVIWNLISPWPEHWWPIRTFITGICILSIYGVVTTVWFSIGGTRDLLRMFKRLRTHQNNPLDDGRVIDHANADDLPLIPGKEESPAAVRKEL